ncbi:MAG: hypothetical protein ACODAQ_04185 [Phycisphaeraceae bacterium]
MSCRDQREKDDAPMNAQKKAQMNTPTLPPLTPDRSRRAAAWCLVVVVCLASAAPLSARTILLGVEDCDGIAAIDAAAPRLSWAMARSGRQTYHTGHMALTEQRSLLMRFDLGRIPPDQRIVHAELVVPVRERLGSDPRFYAWRLLTDWGAGVCHLYRFTRRGESDERIPWTEDGARGIGSDRAAAPTDAVRVTSSEASKYVINVTEDVELWYEDRAENHGWLFSVEDPEVEVRLASPLWHYRDDWTLRITYEPRDE